MSALYHVECRFGSEGQKYLSFLRLWWDMKKEGCSCCWEIEAMLYITTSGDLSTLRLTTPSATISVSVSASSRSLSHSHLALTLLWVLLPFLLHFYISHQAPFRAFIQWICPCSACVRACVCISLHLIEFAAFSPLLPTMLAAGLYLSGAYGRF